MSDRDAARAIVIRDNSLLVMKRNKFGEEYYTLLGGGIEQGEDAEMALRRELREESGLEVGYMRLLFIESASEKYGRQFIFLCDYIGGEPLVSDGSEEALSNSEGQNTYEPMWLPLSELPNVVFRASVVQQAILDGLEKGWPKEVQELAWKQ